MEEKKTRTENNAGSDADSSADSNADSNSDGASSAQTAHENAESADREMADELFGELSHLAGQFVEVVRVAWNSDERRQLEADLKSGLSGVATGLEEGFRKVSENEQTQDVLDKAENVAESVGDKIRDSKAANDLASSLLAGLRTLGEQLEHWAADINQAEGGEQSEGAEPTPQTDEESQDIPIEKT